VQLDGDPEIQQAVRFALFHVLQAGARAEGRAIPAKGLTGPGYDGHCFWDSEAYVLPVLTYVAPGAAAHALHWRHSTLPKAIGRARELGLCGAAFPWRTIAGEACSGYWPAGTAAFHVSAGIADAVIRYVQVTGDVSFERAVGIELLAETARLWRSLGHPDATGRFRIDGVTGPDEYSAVTDNNVYTNLMAQQNLRAAADATARHPGRARELGIGEEEMGAWRDAAEAMYIPYDDALGVHPQSDGFTSHQAWDFAGTAIERYPLLLHFPYFDLYRKQVVKQATSCWPCTGVAMRSHRAEGTEFRLLRSAHGAGLVTVGLHPGCHRRRGGLPASRIRLPCRGCADGSRRLRARYPRRPAHRRPRGQLDRAGCRPGWHAAARGHPALRAAAA
jgi:alpha,alpha-trehalose phosphorylase